MYKEDYIISNSKKRIWPIISPRYYSGKPEILTLGETFSIHFYQRTLLTLENNRALRSWRTAGPISRARAATCPAKVSRHSISRTQAIPRRLMKRRNIINPSGTGFRFLIFQQQDRQSATLQHFFEW